MSPNETAARMDDPLWVPLLTHYQPGGSAAEIDGERMAAHIKAIRPSVRQFLLAGSTGDGWEIDSEAFRAITALVLRADVFEGTHILFGVLRPTTDEVVDRAQELERDLAQNGMPAGEFIGLTVCPPVDPAATQERSWNGQQRTSRCINCHRSPAAALRRRQCAGWPGTSGSSCSRIPAEKIPWPELAS